MIIDPGEPYRPVLPGRLRELSEIRARPVGRDDGMEPALVGRAALRVRLDIGRMEFG
jgi:hypothetical protein